MARDRALPFWSLTGSTSTSPVSIALPTNWAEIKVWVDSDCLVGVGNAYTPPAIAPVSGVTTIESRGTPTAGTFTITANPNAAAAATTETIAYNASAATIKTALIGAGMPFATGDITAAGGALPTAVTLTWTGVYANTAPLLSVISSVTPGVILARVTTTPKGNGGYGYVLADQQEAWNRDDVGQSADLFLYIAAVSTGGNYQITAYR